MRSKGVSPLVATTILIIIAVSLSYVIFNWQSFSIGSFSSSFETATKEKLQCQRASLAVFSASYNCNTFCDEGTAHTISLTLHNPGNIILNPRSIYLKNSTGGLFELSASGELGLGQTLIFQNVSTASCEGISQKIDEIVVTTDCPEVVGILPGSSISWVSCP